jgi:hypothetical protein
MTALSLLALVACEPSGSSALPSGSTRPPAGACDDTISAAAATASPPAGAPAASAYFGSGDTWFMGLPGYRWGQSVQYFSGSYYTKVGIYTLDSHPPRVTVRRTDGQQTGHAEFSPTGKGLPGPLPTGLYFPTAGCWDVMARGSSGSAGIRVRVIAQPGG